MRNIYLNSYLLLWWYQNGLLTLTRSLIKTGINHVPEGNVCTRRLTIKQQQHTNGEGVKLKNDTNSSFDVLFFLYALSKTVRCGGGGMEEGEGLVFRAVWNLFNRMLRSLLQSIFRTLLFLWKSKEGSDSKKETTIDFRATIMSLIYIYIYIHTNQVERDSKNK